MVSQGRSASQAARSLWRATSESRPAPRAGGEVGIGGLRRGGNRLCDLLTHGRTGCQPSPVYVDPMDKQPEKAREKELREACICRHSK